MLDASGDPQRPGMCHGCFEGSWAACQTAGSVGATIPELCGFLPSYGSQGFVSSLGLMGQGEPSSTRGQCWARSPGAGEPALSGSTVFWNYVNEALIISQRLLKMLSSVGNVSICMARGSPLPVSPACCLGNDGGQDGNHLVAPRPAAALGCAAGTGGNSWGFGAAAGSAWD